MKQPSLLKREIALITVTIASLLLVIALAAYIFVLRRTIDTNGQAQSASLSTTQNELSEQATHVDTICGEYRKLYSAYEALSVQSPSASGSGYALPGSAKGEIDTCYQP